MADAVRKKAELERGMTNATRAFRAALSEMCRMPGYRGRPRNDAVVELGFCLRRFKCGKADADDVLDELIESGIVAEVNGRILPAARAVRRTKEERQAAFDGWVQAVSQRATEDPEASLLLATLIRRMTRLHGVHRVSTARGQGILMASRMAFVDGCPTIVEATVIVVGENGLETYEGVENSRITCAWNEDWPAFQCDIAELKRRSRRDQLMDMRLVGTQSAFDLHAILNRSGAALRRLQTQRENIEAFIGLTLPGHRWNGLRMSLRSGKSLVLMARQSMLGLLQQDVRRIALRNPYADFAFYYWIKKCSAADLRRRAQMSEAFPAMTSRMRELDEVIRSERPLLPALQELTGIDVPRLKKLRGVHWQRMGHAMRSLIPDDDFDDVSETLRTVPSQNYPETKKEWTAFHEISHWEIRNWLQEDARRQLLETASRNWVGYSELAKADFGQALSDCAENLVPLIDLRLRTSSVSETVKNSMRRKIFEHVAGDKLGLKRMRLFNEAWHKGSAQRGIAIRSIRRAVFGEEQIATWHPLTDSGFEAATGSLVWLTDEDQLLSEGRQMSHCVGSYWSSCVAGTSHIAQVRGFDGTRSTVEFRISEKGQLSKRQHHTYKNGHPSAACAGVVAKFLSENRKTIFPILQGDGGTRNKKTRGESISIETASKIRKAYEDCLSGDFLDELEAYGRKWRAENADISIDLAETARQVRENNLRDRAIMQALPLAPPCHEDDFD